jgi:hypothetical protein
MGIEVVMVGWCDDKEMRCAKCRSEKMRSNQEEERV